MRSINRLTITSPLIIDSVSSGFFRSLVSLLVTSGLSSPSEGSSSLMNRSWFSASVIERIWRWGVGFGVAN
ncbi:hypothetical protein Hanom_Chr04g00318171 [Helianthus anomalus]